jgi:hypothetical protein
MHRDLCAMLLRVAQLRAVEGVTMDPLPSSCLLFAMVEERLP